MPLPVQLGLLVGSVVAFVLLAATLRKQQTWPALLLWLAPVAMALPLADQAMAGLGRVWPVFTMDGGSGDGWRFGVVFFVVLCTVEISTQLFMTTVAGTNTISRAAQDAPPAPLAGPLPATDAPSTP